MVTTEPGSVEHIPAEAASTYAKLAAAYGGAYYRQVTDAVSADLEPDGTVLDVGTGPGQLPVTLAEQVPDVRIHAFDFTRELLAYGRREASRRGVADRVSFFAADCYAIPAADRSYAGLVCTGVFHTLDEPAAALAEFHRVLVPGGTAWVFDPTILDVPEDPAELGPEFTDREREIFDAYGVRAEDEQRPLPEDRAEELATDSPFSGFSIEAGNRNDVRLSLKRER